MKLEAHEIVGAIESGALVDLTKFTINALHNMSDKQIQSWIDQLDRVSTTAMELMRDLKEELRKLDPHRQANR